MDQATQDRLQKIFGDDATFDRVERKLYSHDVGSVPRLIKPFMPGGLAGGVVRPRDEATLVQLVELAREAGLTLVPRGAATSGYGGVIPAEGAVVVDMRRWKRVVAVDPEAMTVTVEAGVVWKDLEPVLAEHDLALRLYPTSAPASTVAGWLAQGGSGHGSYRYGWFKDNVVSARVVLPTGEVRVCSGAELDVIADAEGTTGFITQVTLLVQPLADVNLLAASFADAARLGEAMVRIAAAQVPLWSVSFINPAAVRLGKTLPAKTHHGHPLHAAHTPPDVPEAYTALFAWRDSSGGDAASVDVEAALAAIISEVGGTELAAEIAEHEWELRFSPMRIKRIGPSLIPTEVVVPTKGLGAALADIERDVELPIVIEGVGVAGDGFVLLGFIPHDERTFGFNVAFGLALSVIKIAMKHGGRAYSTGVYFKRHADDILGAQRVKTMQVFKGQIDPNGLMNPGKVWGNGALTTLMGMAETFEPIIRSVANSFEANLGEEFAGGKHGVPDEIARYAYACAQCGYCVEGCTQFGGRGWESSSPRGKWYFLREVLEGREEITPEWVDKFLLCTTCEKCEQVCPLNLPIEPAWGVMRGELIQDQGKMTFPPFEIMAASMRKEGNIWANYRKDRDAWVDEDLKPSIAAANQKHAKLAYFAGCTASFVEQDIAKGTARLLEAAGVEFQYLGTEENCCGIPMLISGRWDVWESNLRSNIENMQATGADTVVTSCPACYLVWKTYYPDWAAKLSIEYHLEAKHYSEVLADEIRSGRLTLPNEIDLKKVTFHDSCHAGRACGLYDPPRELLEAIPGVELVEMEHNREEGLCCGSVLTLIGETKIAPVIGGQRLQEAEDAGVQDLVALCPCCQFQLRVSAEKIGSPVRVHDLASLAAQSLGVEMPDSVHACTAAWSVFDQMIELMQPQNMAAVMAELFPQMLDAMPMGMGGMMRAMGKVPGALDAMKPLMPKMFPMLMPSIMPKVMPDMVAAVGRRIEMPDYMREQMPDLLPQTMESLMPNMLPLLMPYVVPSMIRYLKGEDTVAATS
jgi:Fe-S oxidoreductase/FAD/FMN-containing dehydrogenase